MFDWARSFSFSSHRWFNDSILLPPDHKRIGETIRENTEECGSYAPAPLVTPALLDRIETDVLVKVITCKRGIDYRGVLYAGLMITPDGNFKVLI